KINKDLISSKESIAKREMAEEIVENISEKLSFELPERIIQQEQLSVLRQFLSSQPQQSLKKEDIENLKSEAKKKAEKNLKNHLVLRKISEKENLKVSEEEVTDELRAIAKTNNVSLAQVIDSINKEGKREELRDNILIKKTVDFLVECAIIE
ncbi:MAG: trigger factor, partial [Candidatus Aminicenantes bacterium]|nr:trigger factor [Candidatus Aminicenantes bacterium]